MQKSRIGAISLFALLCYNAIRAQNNFEHGLYKVQKYTETDGMVSAEVTDTYKDRKGFLWISTFQGLSRFDGHQFKNFGRENGLAESNIDLLGEDAGGRVYVKSVSNVYKYTGSETRAFLPYPTKGKFISAACPADADGVWVAYDGETGMHLLLPDGESRRIDTETPIFRLLKGKQDEIYVLEMSGRLSLLKNGHLSFVYIIKPKLPFTNEGIRIFKDARERVWSYGANNPYLYQHQGETITDSIEVPANTRWWQWWVGPNKDVYHASDTGTVFQLQNGRWESIFNREQIKGSIYEVKEDKQGILWISSSGGLIKVTHKRYQNVAARSPNWYYTTDQKGRYILQSDSLLYVIPNAIRHFYHLQSRVITNVYITRRQEVWYCTEEAVYRLPYGKKLQKVNTSRTYEGTTSLFRFRRVLEDNKGGIYISSYHGIFYSKGDALQYYWTREGLTEGAIYTIAIDRNGIFYAAGVHVFALMNGKFIDLSQQLNLPNEISRLSTDREGALWITQEGGNQIRKISYTNKRFQMEDSVPLRVNGIPFTASSSAFDAANNLWVCNHRSLYCFRKEGSRYNPSPSFFDEEFSGSPLLYSDDSNWLQVLSAPLAGNYLRTYSAGLLLARHRAQIPTVFLTAISLFKEAFDWTIAGFNTDVLGIPQQLSLRHDQNFLRFAFTALTNDFNRNVAYRFRLSGYDKGWSPPTEKGEAEYTGLPPGQYTFEVQARSAGGEWSTPLHYLFTIRQSWYLTFWAKVVWVLLFLLLLGGLVFFRFRSLKRKERVRQLLIEERLKALRAQINPHFLQNTFAFLAHELYAAHNTKAVKAIDRLSVYLRDVLRYSDKAAITLEEELEFAGEYLQMQQEMLSVSFTYEIQVPEDVDVFDIQVPSMLLQPLIENAIKYGIDERSGGFIHVLISAHYPYIHCIVRDSGRKTPSPGTLPHSGSGKGIALTQDRMQLFYSGKRNRPQFHRARNRAGGCDITLLIPLD